MQQYKLCGLTLLLACWACASSPKPVKNAGLRHTAAHDLSCPEEQLAEESLGSAVRVSGCGHSAIYSCKSSGPSGQTPNPHGIQTHEAGVKPYGAAPPPCSWVKDE